LGTLVFRGTVLPIIPSRQSFLELLALDWDAPPSPPAPSCRLGAV
jgi:hypothetical protein